MGTIHSRIYLTSQSPRYRDSLNQIGVSFELLLPRNDPRRGMVMDETPRPSKSVSDYLERICCARAVAGQTAMLARGLRVFPALAANCAIELNGKRIGKPRDQSESADIRRELSGQQHQVTSTVAMAMAFQDRVALRRTSTSVTFATLDEERISLYVIGNEGLDRTGAYAVEGLGGAF